MNQSVKQSDLADPLRFFENLLLFKMEEKYMSDFLPTKDDLKSPYVIYDPKLETKHEIIYGGEAPNLLKSTSFQEFYKSEITEQIIISLELINVKIGQLITDEEKISFLKHQNNNLNYLLDKFSNNTNLRFTEINYNAIEFILNNLRERYSIYIKYISTNELRSFNWKHSNKDILSKTLYNKMLEFKLIDKLEINIFKKAFDGSIIQKPLNICWLPKAKNPSTNIRLLFYLIDKLSENLIYSIDKDKTLIITIKNVFSRGDGKKWGNISSNISNAKNKDHKNRPDEYSIIDNLIKQLEEIANPNRQIYTTS